MQILADANSSRNRNALGNWMYPKAVDVKMRRGLLPVWTLVQDQRTRARDMNFEFSHASVFHSFARTNVDFRARIPRVCVRARPGHPAACGDANLAENVPSLIKNRKEIEREQENRRCSRARVRSVPLDGKRERNARDAHTFINFACLVAPLAVISLTTCRQAEREKEKILRQRARHAENRVF